ncbi:MAG: hypothetical protein DMD79_19405 [Candidatus Rokuibacteriota bacterium]|nr:MAG: hypothetical protein DMD79_19405 [Candidatus Rokubacteria bacterium]
MIDVEGGDDLPRNSPWGGPSERGLKLRKRDDYGVELFRQALEHLADPPRLRHALLELTRAYNPLDDGPILPPGVRQTVLALAEAGEVASARRLLESRLDAYARRGRPETAT